MVLSKDSFEVFIGMKEETNVQTYLNYNLLNYIQARFRNSKLLISAIFLLTKFCI